MDGDHSYRSEFTPAGPSIFWRKQKFAKMLFEGDGYQLAVQCWLCAKGRRGPYPSGALIEAEVETVVLSTWTSLSDID
ncbi:unnamed protein product [Haemonchus placei]|uniref:Uncharacterized protein n=1 Tax=Haemonchus placei TaxID=6290 RepID=A0A0N4WB00_HAEPC|nr:unnamed protein product [Haemonchus placei]